MKLRQRQRLRLRLGLEPGRLGASVFPPFVIVLYVLISDGEQFGNASVVDISCMFACSIWDRTLDLYLA